MTELSVICLRQGGLGLSATITGETNIVHNFSAVSYHFLTYFLPSSYLILTLFLPTFSG